MRKNLFGAGGLPTEISAESHSVDIFASLVANSYTAFNLVDGLTVAKRYGRASIATTAGPSQFRFQPHSAGPFGEDIQTPWEDADTFLYTLAAAGLGWKDIHASRVIPPQPVASHREILWRQATAVARKIGAGLRARLIRG